VDEGCLVDLIWEDKEIGNYKIALVNEVKITKYS